jgi:hypothetical protein
MTMGPDVDVDAYPPMLRHDYFIRVWDDAKKCETFHRILGRGQAFPTPSPVKALDVAATHDGQVRLGLEIFELPEAMRLRESLTIDSQGRLHLSKSADRALKQRQALNIDHSEFLIADPPCERGDRRFHITFGLDDQKRLTISVTDNHPTGKSKVITPNGDEDPLPVTDMPLIQLNA